MHDIEELVESAAPEYLKLQAAQAVANAMCDNRREIEAALKAEVYEALRPARGIMFACAIALPFWALMGFMIWTLRG